MKNPHDGRFKGLAEGHPELLLRLFGLWDPGMKATPIALLRELHLDPVQIDHAYLIGSGAAAEIHHFEAVTRWHVDRIGTHALHRFLLRQKYGVKVHSYLVWMAEKYMPKNVPALLRYEDQDGFQIAAPYRSIRLWEIDPALAFEPGSEPLLPWVPLLRGGLPEMAKARDAIADLLIHPEKAPAGLRGEVLAGSLASLASLRYDKVVLAQFLEGMQRDMTLSTDLFKETWLYRDAFADGEAEGKAVGEAEGELRGEVRGELKGKREAVAAVMGARFPSLSTDLLFGLTNLAALDDLLMALVNARHQDEAEAALRRARAQDPSSVG